MIFMNVFVVPSDFILLNDVSEFNSVLIGFLILVLNLSGL